MAGTTPGVPLRKSIKYRKLWDPTTNAELFGGEFRIYLPLVESSEPPEVPYSIRAALEEKGYEVVDYLAGLAAKKDDPKRRMKIGRLLKEPYIKKIFDNDPQRSASRHTNRTVVISRHPHDLAGMSYAREWDSCMNVVTGENRKFIQRDIRAGVMIAYLISEEDRNIKNPGARLLIKPFVNILDRKKGYFKADEKIYGAESKAFLHTVNEWIKIANEGRVGLFHKNPSLYDNDGYTDGYALVGEPPADREIVKRLNAFPKLIRYVRKPSEKTLNRLKERSPYYLKDVETLPLSIQRDLIRNGTYSMQYIKNPDQGLVREAFVNDIGVFPYIKDPTIAEMIRAVEARPYLLDQIVDPPLRLQLAAVRKSYYAIGYIKNPSAEVQMAAVKKHGRVAWNHINGGKLPDVEKFMEKRESEKWQKEQERRRKKREALKSSDADKGKARAAKKRLNTESGMLWMGGMTFETMDLGHDF